MGYEPENLENEINDLKQELEHFQQDKERVRYIIGKANLNKPKFFVEVLCSNIPFRSSKCPYLSLWISLPY